MKIAEYEIKAPYPGTAYSLFKDGLLHTSLCFGTYEAACKFFIPYIKNNCLDVTVPEEVDGPFLSTTNPFERTVGGYTNSGYLKLMGEEFI
jgi:hypothetical protein